MEFGVFILARQRGCRQTSQQVINNSIEQTIAAEQAIDKRLGREPSASHALAA